MTLVAKLFDISQNALYDNETKQLKLKDELVRLAKKGKLNLEFEVEDTELFIEVSFESRRGGYAVPREVIDFIDLVANKIQKTEVMDTQTFEKLEESLTQAVEHAQGKRDDFRKTVVAKPAKKKVQKTTKMTAKAVKKVVKKHAKK